jgi:hypothetical protein
MKVSLSLLKDIGWRMKVGMPRCGVRPFCPDPADRDSAMALPVSEWRSSTRVWQCRSIILFPPLPSVQKSVVCAPKIISQCNQL